MGYRLQRSGLKSITPTAGRRESSRMINGAQSHFVTLRITGDVVISVAAATAILNRGSILAAFDEIGISENGTDVHLYDGKVLRFLSEMSAPSALSAVRLTSTAVGTTSLSESVRIYFAHPYAANPRETAFLEHNVQQALEVFVKQRANAATFLATAGAATVVLQNVSVKITQGYVGTETDRPFYIPKVYQQVVSVTGANTQLQEYIKTNNALRAIVVSQETTGIGEVSDVLNGLRLKGDSRDIIGPNSMTLAELQEDGEFEFGGAVVASNRSHVGFNFQQFGRLANLLTPGQDVNLRFEFDVQKSVIDAASTSQLRITRVELSPDSALCKPLTIPV
jgi:hypothetical protein